MTEVLSLAAVLFALGPEVGLDRTFLTGLQDDTEDLFARPQSHGLRDTQHSHVSESGRQPVALLCNELSSAEYL